MAASLRCDAVQTTFHGEELPKHSTNSTLLFMHTKQPDIGKKNSDGTERRFATAMT